MTIIRYEYEVEVEAEVEAEVRAEVEDVPFQFQHNLLPQIQSAYYLIEHLIAAEELELFPFLFLFLSVIVVCCVC